MAKSTGIVLTATAISFGNEWVQTYTPNFRILIAGGALSLLFDGIEQVSPQAAYGLGVLMMVTVLVTPFNGKSPVQTLADWAVGQQQHKFGPAATGNFGGGRTF